MSWSLLKEFVKSGNNKERIIPVVGCGFNKQAGIPVGDWPTLLIQVYKEIGIQPQSSLKGKKFFGSMTGIWEHMIRQCLDKQKREAAYLIEEQLQKIVTKELRKFEGNPQDNDFFKRFLKIEFQDIFSLNFDRCLSLPNKIICNNPKFSKLKHIATLYRFANINNVKKTRIWYPHGDTQKTSTIKLGVRTYGKYIDSMDKAVGAFKQKESYFFQEKSLNKVKQKDYLQWAKYYKETIDETSSWLGMSFCSPLLFLGCGMSQEEWPLWWWLNQRARNQAKIPEKDRDPIFILWEKEKNIACNRKCDFDYNLEFINNSNLGIRILSCENWKEGWGKIFKAFKV